MRLGCRASLILICIDTGFFWNTHSIIITITTLTGGIRPVSTSTTSFANTIRRRSRRGPLVSAFPTYGIVCTALRFSKTKSWIITHRSIRRPHSFWTSITFYTVEQTTLTSATSDLKRTSVTRARFQACKRNSFINMINFGVVLTDSILIICTSRDLNLICATNSAIPALSVMRVATIINGILC